MKKVQLSWHLTFTCDGDETLVEENEEPNDDYAVGCLNEAIQDELDALLRFDNIHTGYKLKQSRALIEVVE